MHRTFSRLHASSAAPFVLVLASISTPAAAQTATGDRTEDIVVTGTRGIERSVSQSLAPIDVVGREAIAANPGLNLNDLLATTIPSFGVQSLPGVDGLGVTRPVALRNLSPDQTLVLVNGHRRHRSAYVDILYTGAQAIDLGQIPSSAIGRVEVLRDGASAQYGSDAIAGVINILLDDKPGTEISAQAGQYYAGDGFGFVARGRTGLSLAGGGIVSVSGDYGRQNATNRSVGVRNRLGQPSSDSYHLAYNLRVPLNGGLNLYSFGTLARSSSVQDFSYRAPGSSVYARSFYQNGGNAVYPNWNLLSVYPDGFIPQLNPVIRDGQITAGIEGKVLPDLKIDISADYGRDAIEYRVRNSINASLGPQSPTSFNSGEIVASETRFAVDATYVANLGFAKPVGISFGGSFAREQSESAIGDEASYVIGPLADLPSGAYGFPGLKPANALNYSRDNLAAYADIAVDLTKALSVGLAGRYEHYSDFGSNFSYKVSGRYQLAPWAAVRATYNTGFHAPAPGQESFTKLTTAPDATQPAPYPISRIGLVSPTDPLAAPFGGRALKPEKSRNVSAGLVLTPARGITLTVDYYHIHIDDRIAISPQFRLAPGQAYDQIQFLINGYDSNSDGFDVVGSWNAPLAGGTATFSIAYNYNKTKIANVLSTLPLNVLRPIAEDGRPHHSAFLTADYAVGAFRLRTGLRYYGAYVDAIPVAQPPPFANQRVSGRALVDVSASYDVTPSTRLTVGAENLFDTYPDRATSIVKFLGYKYPLLRPYDTDGGHWYVRMAQRF